MKQPRDELTIRPYQPGDEQAQAHIFNEEGRQRDLIGFKPANPEEIARRYRTVDPDPTSKFYAVRGDEVVGYAVFNPNGRISYPWSLPGTDVRDRLLDEVLSAMSRRGVAEAWVAYRADWAPILSFFESKGFAPTREMINYVAELKDLPRVAVPRGMTIRPVERENMPRLAALGDGLFAGDPEALGRFFWDNPFLDPTSLFALRRDEDDTIVGLGLTAIDARFADPTKLDSAMPCFRLGAFGTESERHKRVNGLVSLVMTTDNAGTVLLSEAARRLEQAGLSHAAAQVPSDQTRLVAFFDRHFQRQGAFPILSRRLTQPVS